MKLKPAAEVATSEEARDIAVEWQHWASQRSMSLDELIEYQGYFETLAQRFDLTEEFKENAIL